MKIYNNSGRGVARILKGEEILHTLLASGEVSGDLPNESLTIEMLRLDSETSTPTFAVGSSDGKDVCLVFCEDPDTTLGSKANKDKLDDYILSNPTDYLTAHMLELRDYRVGDVAVKKQKATIVLDNFCPCEAEKPNFGFRVATNLSSYDILCYVIGVIFWFIIAILVVSLFGRVAGRAFAQGWHTV